MKYAKIALSNLNNIFCMHRFSHCKSDGCEFFLKKLLVYFVKNGNLEEAEKILKELKSPDVNLNLIYAEIVCTDYLGHQAKYKHGLMHLAVMSPGDSVEMLDLLYNYGVEPYQLPRQNRGPCRHERKSGTNISTSLDLPVIYATELGKTSRVEWFEQKGQRLDQKLGQPDGLLSVTLLDVAARHGHKELFKNLLEKTLSLYLEGTRRYPLQEAKEHSVEMEKFASDLAKEHGLGVDLAPPTSESEMKKFAFDIAKRCGLGSEDIALGFDLPALGKLSGDEYITDQT